jgi:CDP-glycerol glycerophosphotransferase
MDNMGQSEIGLDRQHRSAPLISLVLPVYNAQDYLPRCLDAITRQEFTDFEIVAVDGASEDGSHALLEERRLTEPRLRVLRDKERIGPGRARNGGAREAKGTYLWFVDADDIVTPGCLAVIADALVRNSPDVLLVDYVSVPPRGRPESGPLHYWSFAKTQTCFTIADHPEVVDQSMASWNKIIRREFFKSSKAAFLENWPHEDVPASCRVLLDAQQLSVLDHVCYRYCKSRPGSVMEAGKPRRHFRIFDAWRQVLDAAQIKVKSDDPLMTRAVYQALFERAIYHYSTILESGGGRSGAGGYVPRHDRREFFEFMHVDYIKYMPLDYWVPPGLRGIKFGFISRNDYRAYSVFEPVNKSRVRVARARKAVHSRLQNNMSHQPGGHSFRP